MTKAEEPLSEMEQCLQDVHVFNPDKNHSVTLNEFKDAERKSNVGKNSNDCPYFIAPSISCKHGSAEPIQQQILDKTDATKYLSAVCDVSTSACNNRKTVNFADMK